MKYLQKINSFDGLPRRRATPVLGVVNASYRRVRGEWGELSGNESWHTALYEEVCGLGQAGQQLTTRTSLGHRPGLHLKNINLIALVFFVLFMVEVFGFVFGS